MIKRVSLCIIILSVVLNICCISFANTNTPAAVPTPAVNDQLHKEVEKTTKSMFGGLFDGISNTFNGIKTFFEDGVGGVIEKSLGDIFESFVNATAIDGKWVFSTPTLIDYDWVKKLWWIMFFLSIGSIGIGMGITMLRILSGKYKGNLRTALISFLFSAIMLMFSLFVADKMILFGNDLINSFSRTTLTTEAQKPENQSAILLKEIDYSKIGFHYFDGKSLVNLSFGSKLGDPEPMYKQFLTKNGGGGALILVWAMLVVALIGIFGTLRQFVIGIINGLGPLWISISAWTGNMKPIYGYLNLNIRCIALSFVFDLTWLICMYITNHSGDFAVGKQLGATLMYTIALVVSCFLFGYWVYQAFRSPIDLAGGLVQEKAIKMFTRAYPAAGAAAKILGAAQNTQSTDSKQGSDSSGSDDDSSYESGPKTEVKDRLTPAEQNVKSPIPVNTGNQDMDLQAKPNTQNSEMRYDNTIGRPVKSTPLPASVMEYHTNRNQPLEEKTQSYQRTSALKDQIENYNKRPESNENQFLNKADEKKNTDTNIPKQVNVNNQARDALKQAADTKPADIKPSKNGGKLLDSIKNDKKGGEKS